MTDHDEQDAFARRPFGSSGLEVTPLCLGCAPLASMPEMFSPVPEAQALDVLRAAFASPIRFLDTAAGYGDGESERRIGLALRERGGSPADYVLATKVDREATTGDWSGDQMRRSVERSLKLLGVEHLPIVYVHDPETTTFDTIMSTGGAVDVLQRYHEQGVIGTIGVAGGPINLMMRYVETGAFEAVLTHNRYTLITRSAEPLLDLATSRGLAVLNAAPYGGGMLAKGPDNWSKFAYREASPALVERVRQMDAVCQRYGVPLGAAALQFSLRDPRVTSTVVGMTRPERVAQTVALARHPIPEQLWPELEKIARSAAHVDTNVQ